MKIATLFEEIVCRTNIHDDFNNVEDVTEKEMLFSYDFGGTAFKKINFNGIRLLYGRLKFKKPVPVKMQSSNPYMEMYFSLAGTRHMLFTQSNKRFSIAAGHQNLFYIPDTEFYIEPLADDIENITLQIQFTEDYFKRLMPVNNSLFLPFTDKINRKQFSVLNPSDLVITPKMYNVLNDIVHCEKTGIIKQLYIEANVLKLLQLQFEQYEVISQKKEYTNVKHYDIDKLYHARELLEQNITNPYSLLKLAHKTGLNDFKLKKGFKELFGNTVFGYLHEIRMQKAREMLFDHKTTIADVSQYCGYAFIQSFTKAFKQKYGMTPEQYRKQY